MTAERFRQIRNVFEAALDQSATDRLSWVKDACSGDPELQAGVLSLLKHHDERSFLIDRAALGLVDPAAGDPLSRWEGRRLGPWEILREVGQGGMATVYLARRADGAFQKHAAVKIMRSGLPDRELLERFEQEREILAQLDHPNICRLLDGGSTPEGIPFLVMEYIEGEPLSAYCARRQLDTEQRLRLFEQLCTGVEYLHSHGIVHRDLKPPNILVGSAGQLKILDFGIAKILQPSGERTVLMTHSGRLCLTPEYASPEQVRGDPITPRTDTYAMGVILYELLTGRGPYRIEKRLMHEIVRAICEEEPEAPSSAVKRMGVEPQGTSLDPSTPRHVGISSPGRLSRKLEGELDDIVLKSLRKQPERRYRSASQLAADLSAYRERRPVLAQHDPWWIRGLGMASQFRVPIGVAFLLVVLVATGGITLHTSGIPYAVGALALVSIYSASTHPRVARWLAIRGPSYRMRSALLLLLTLLFILSIVPDRYSNWLQPVFYAGLATYCAMKLVMWTSRLKWAGQLVLDASGLPSRTLIAAIAFSALGQEIGHTMKQPDLEAVTRIACLGLILASAWVFSHKLEFRDRGILHSGRLILWDDIESWNWESDKRSPQFLFRASGAEAVILNIDRRRALHLLPPVRVRVSPAQVDTVQELMERFLSEWPATARKKPGQDSQSTFDLSGR